jgi:hypothetical protein
MKIIVEIHPWAYEILSKDYQKLNDDPTYTFDNYMSDLIDDEARHVIHGIHPNDDPKNRDRIIDAIKHLQKDDA